ncbi:hypothetical protein Tco_0188927 [Tanacetum coccineum]
MRRFIKSILIVQTLDTAQIWILPQMTSSLLLCGCCARKKLLKEEEMRRKKEETERKVRPILFCFLSRGEERKLSLLTSIFGS